MAVAMVRKMRQPWLFIYYAVAFGALMYLFRRDGVAAAIFAGVLFATLMSIWREVRRRRSRARDDA